MHIYQWNTIEKNYFWTAVEVVPVRFSDRAHLVDMHVVLDGREHADQDQPWYLQVDSAKTGVRYLEGLYPNYAAAEEALDSLVAFGTFHRDRDRHGIENIIVVCHGVTLRAFIMMWFHRTPEWFEQERNPNNCAVRLIEYGQDRGYIFNGFCPNGAPA